MKIKAQMIYNVDKCFLFIYLIIRKNNSIFLQETGSDKKNQQRSLKRQQNFTVRHHFIFIIICNSFSFH